MKLKNVSKKINSFLFKLLPNVIQEFLVWKYKLGEDNFSTEFDKFLAKITTHEFSSIYAIIDTKEYSLNCYNGKVAFYLNYESALIDFVGKKFKSDENNKIVKIDLSLNIRHVYEH